MKKHGTEDGTYDKDEAIATFWGKFGQYCSQNDPPDPREDDSNHVAKTQSFAYEHYYRNQSTPSQL